MKPREQKELPEVLTPEELGERWRRVYDGRVVPMHPVTLAKWRQEGKGPKWFKIGRYVFYYVHEVEAYEEQQRRESTAG